jgi:signal transduction histidine kinase/CheY-like chemotaxis protein
VTIFTAKTSDVALLNPERTTLTFMADYVVNADVPSITGATISLADNPASIDVVKTGKSVVVPQAQTNPQLRSSHHIQKQRHIHCRMIVPLISHGKVIGTISVGTDQEDRVFTSAEVILAETIAGQIAGAIENARLFTEERRQRQMAESLRQVATVLTSSLDQTIVLKKILEQLRRVVQYNSAAVFLQDGDHLVLSDGADIREEHIGRRMPLSGTSPEAEAVNTKRWLIIPDVLRDRRWKVWSNDEYIRSWMCAPLFVGDNAIGLLTADSFEVDSYHEDDAQILQTFANQAAIAIENARLFDEEQRQRQVAESLREVATILTSSLDQKTLLVKIMQLLGRVIKYDSGEIFLIDGDALVLSHAIGPGDRFIGQRVPLSASSPVVHVFKRKRSRIIADTLADPDWEVWEEGEVIRSWMGVPLLTTDNQVLGVLTADSFEVNSYGEEDVLVLQTFANQAAVAIENARLFEQIQQAKEAAEVANQAKSTFLANMSHELRTPLNAILGFAQILAREPHTPEEKENLVIIQRSGEHLLRLINQVLDLSKIEAGRITLNAKDFNLHRLLDDLEDMFFLAQKKGLRLRFERADDVPQYVRTDEIKLRQVLINLLGNAIKFTEQGGVTLEVTKVTKVEEVPSREGVGVGSQSSIVNLQFSILDTGIGIAPQELEAIFQPFIQSEYSGWQTEGTGLGLAISRAFVGLMGGELRATSTVGAGSCFTFAIPVELADAVTIRPAHAPCRVMRLAPNQPAYRLLVVDDDADNRAFLTELLGSVGFEVYEAANGVEAVAQYVNFHPHLIWMDIQLPIMNGYDTTALIRESEGCSASLYPPTIVIALTGHAFEEEREKILAAGCDDFLRKPFQEHEIFNLLQQQLGVRFVYEEEQQVAGRRSQVAGEEVLTPEALAALPKEMVTELQQAAEALNVNTANRIIDQIHQHNAPLAEALAELVKNYRFDRLQALLEQIEH